MVTTAALAWRTMGRSEFQKHVAVLQLDTKRDNLPTLLVKMQPWTREELNELRQFNADIAGDWPFQLLEDPTDRVQSFLSTAFYSGELPKALVASMDYRVEPATDNRPYFNFLRKKPGPLTGNAEVYLDWPTATVLNSQLRKNVIPMDLIHLIVTSVVSLFFAVIFIIVPLYFADVGRVRWKFKYASLVYFACLGAGFITVELVFIQLFMKLIGFPVYTYSTVIFTLLLSAGLGSFSSGKLGVAPDRRWSWPFVGILSTGVALLLVHAPVFDIFLATPEAVRIAVAAALIFPLGFFLGMAFPLGIVTLKDEPRGAIAWAWGVNGLFTVIGGLASVVSSMLLGHGMTLVLALMTYVIAFGVFSRMRTAAA